MPYPATRCELGCTAAENHAGRLPGLALHFKLLPHDTVADAGAESLGGSLLGGKPGGKAFRGGYATSLAVGDFNGRIDVTQEAIAKAFERAADPSDFNQVDAGTKNHRQALPFAGLAGCIHCDHLAGSSRIKLTRPATLSDARVMEPSVSKCAEDVFTAGQPLLQLRAFSLEGHAPIVRLLPRALTASGAWMLRQEAAGGVLRYLFEFERSNGIHVYIMMMSLGLELTRNSHLIFTSFCQRTHNLPATETLLVTTCDLEVRELADDAGASEPLFGGNSSA